MENNKDRIEIDLTTKDGLFKLTELVSEESAPLYELEAKIRGRLQNEGKPISIEEVRKYDQLLKSMRRNTDILSRLIGQAIELQHKKILNSIKFLK